MVIQTNPTFNYGHTDSPSNYQLLYITALEEHCDLEQGRSGRSSRTTCCPRHSAMLPEQTFQRRNPLQQFPWRSRDRTRKQFLKLTSCLFMNTYITLPIHF